MQSQASPALSPSIRIVDSFPDPVAAKYTEELWYRQHENNIVIINSFAKDIYYPQHWSPLSVKCAFGGREYYHFGNATLSAGDDHFLIVNEGSVYESSIKSETQVESFTLNFTPQNIDEIYKTVSSTAMQQMDNPFSTCNAPVSFAEKMYPYHPAVRNILLTIRKLVKEKQKDNNLYLENCYALLENLVMLHHQTRLEIENVHAVKQSTKEEMYKRLTLAKDYMESCFHQDISLHDLSRICFLHPHYLLREFKKYYAVTPHRYLTLRRLREASALLLTTDMDITELTRTVGFTDASSFSKLFKKNYGLSPEHFRKKN